MSTKESMKYENVIRKRESRSTGEVGYLTEYLKNFIVIPRIGQALSLMLRFPFVRIAYVCVMNSPLSPKKLGDRLESGVRRAVTFHPPLSKAFRTGKALIIYYSMTGNTAKVALAIEESLRKAGLEPIVKKVSEAYEEELYDYDLVFLGTPVIHGLPPHPVMRFILEKGYEYRSRGFVGINTQYIPGKKAVVFVTYSGPHIGLKEAVPAGKYLGQSLEHLGFEVEEWYVVGEFHGWKEGSTMGRLGDIRGRPNAEDLARIEERTIRLVRSLESCS
jgi:flavodoxin